MSKKQFYKCFNKVAKRLLLNANEFVGEILHADEDIIFVLIRFSKASLNGIFCCLDSCSLKSRAVMRKILCKISSSTFSSRRIGKSFNKC